MHKSVDINAVIGDLELIDSKIDAEEPLVKVYEIFETEQHISGIIVTKKGNFFKMLSRRKFFEVMSKQFMFDLYLKRTAEEFFFENAMENYLTFPSLTPVLAVANKALLRNEATRHDPIIVEFGNGELKLLDFFELLLAQTRVHMLASNLLKEANEFKKDVLGVLGHDLRNPINAVLGFVGELVSDPQLSDESKSYVEYIETAANQMRDLVEGVLKTAINDALDFELSLSNFNLIDLINSIVFSFQKNLELKNQTLEFQYGSDTLELNADKYKLKEVLENLISNASKYSENGKTIKIIVKDDDQSTEIQVIDEGPGFTKQDLSKIFGKFQKLSAQPTNNESSTGLGLYIVKKIIKQHKGQILLESEVNKGSTFKIILPKAEINKDSSSAEIYNEKQHVM